MGTTKDRIYDVIEKQLGVKKESITRDQSFVDDLGADSLDQVELIMELEAEFDITIPEDDCEGLATVGKLVDYIEKVLSAR